MITISRVKHGFADILQPKNLGGEPLQPDGQAAVWRHSEFEHAQMILERSRIHSATAEGGFERVTLMEALATRGDFKTLQQQVKALGGTGRTAWGGVERPIFRRKTQHKHRRYS